MDNSFLAFEDMKNAPEELKTAAINHRTSFIRMQKAEKQFKLWDQEQAHSKAMFGQTLREFNAVLERWDPSTNAIISKEDYK